MNLQDKNKQAKEIADRLESQKPSQPLIIAMDNDEAGTRANLAASQTAQNSLLFKDKSDGGYMERVQIIKKGCSGYVKITEPKKKEV
jgi:hypothetical protein